jgi:hypothetical protein
MIAAAATPARTGPLEDVLLRTGIPAEQGLEAISNGMAFVYGEVLRLSPDTLRGVVRHAGGIASGISAQLEANPLFRDAVVRRIQEIAARTGARAAALVAELGKPSNWLQMGRQSGGLRVGAASIEVFGVLAVGLAVGAFTIEHYRTSLADYTAALDSLNDAQHREALHHIVAYMLERVAQNRQHLCNGMSFGEASRRIAANLSMSRLPYLGVLEKCDIVPGGSASAQARAFAIIAVHVPDVLVNGPRLDMTVSYSGNPRFPVTVTARPTQTPCLVTPKPPTPWNCFTETRVFNQANSEGQLVMKGAAWCAGNLPKGAWVARYEAVLRDGAGQQTAAVPMHGACIVR